MELNLIVPVTSGAKEIGDEEIHGKLWRVTGPHDINDIENLKFYCVSYVWGTGTKKEGSFFNCKREISDQTRPVLASAMKAADVIRGGLDKPIVEAFWIDAICIPQLESPERFKTLESMGFIYSAAISVIIVLQQSMWKVIESVSSKVSPRPLSYQEMQILEDDNWISRVWTYQELVNSRDAFFTSLAPEAQGHAIQAQSFFSCVGCFDQWKRTTGNRQSTVLERFHNIHILEDTLADSQLGNYLERVALRVLSNMALRTFDSEFPQNRLLASLGALTQDASWGPPSTTLAELAEKLMSICESNGDYSFIYTSDIRNHTPGMRWRPNSFQLPSKKPVHLVPVANWHSWGTQDSHKDLRGFWLDNMMLLKPAEKMNEEAEKRLDRFVYGFEDPREPGTITGGVFHHKDGGEEDLSQAVLRFLRMIGFKGDREPQVCQTGLFFSQLSLNRRDSVEMYAATGIRWMFGSPRLARWKEGGEFMYCAGVFTGAVKIEVSESLLIE